MGGMPRLQYPYPRLHCTDKIRSGGIKIPVMVYRGDTRLSTSLSCKGFNISPWICTIVRVAGQVSAGVIRECTVSQAHGDRAHIFGRQFILRKAARGGKVMGPALSITGPDISICGQVPNRK